ncbi:hypothetical protein ABK040_000598 [Willaertia magna]
MKISQSWILLTCFLLLHFTFLSRSLDLRSLMDNVRITSFFQKDEDLPTIDWFQCKPFLHGTESVYKDKLKEFRNTYSECGFTSVPIRWSLDTKETPNTIVFPFVKRFPAYSTNKKGQIMIHVHPFTRSKKLTISLLSPTYDLFALQLRDSLNGEYDIYIPQVSGTGFSRPSLACSIEKKTGKRITEYSEFLLCMNSLVHQSDYISESTAIASYSITQHAMDSLNLLRLTRFEELQRRRLVQEQQQQQQQQGLYNNNSNNNYNYNNYNEPNNFEEFKTIIFSSGFSTLFLNRMLHVVNIIKKKRKEMGLQYANEFGVNMSEFIDMINANAVITPHIPSLNLVNHDKIYNNATLSFLNECFKDDFCKLKFKGKSINELMINLYKSVIPQCYPSTKVTEVKRILSYFASDTHLRKYILPILYRASRCKYINWEFISKYSSDTNDFGVLPSSIYTTGKIPSTFTSFLSYWALERIIVGSELIYNNSVPTYEANAASYKNLPFSLDYSRYFYYAFKSRQNLQILKNESLQFNFTTTGQDFKSAFATIDNPDLPMLILNGLSNNLYPFENNAKQWREHFLGSNRTSKLNGLVEVKNNRHFVVFPYINLNVVLESSISNSKSLWATEPTTLPNMLSTCAAQIIVSFIKSNGKIISTDCLYQMYGDFINGSEPSFFRSQFFNSSTWNNNEKNLSKRFFGTLDFWEEDSLLLEKNYMALGIGLSISTTSLILLSLIVLGIYFYFKKKGYLKL